MASTNETKVTGIPVPAEGTPEFEKMNRMARRAIPLVLIIFIFGILEQQAFGMIFVNIGQQLGTPELASLITSLPGIALGIVDTPGAFCGIEAEERGQGEAIARNLFEMSSMKVPILSVVIGEGGSGGALALAVADEVWMLENAIYSVLSPEGFASILWKDSKRASEAAAVMKLTAADLKKLGVIEAVIAEPEVYTEETMQSVVFVLQKKITEFLDTHCNFSPEELAAQRYERFRKM